jgi:Mrp family chromosome partitioning ATPase
LLLAQRDEPVKREASPSLRIVQAAFFPAAPIKPNRPFLALVGLASGLWMGVLWAFARVALGHDVLPAPAPAPQPVVGALPVVEARAPAMDVATQVEAIVEYKPGPRVVTPSTPPAKESFWRPPLRLRVTQRGVVDLAAILAHTGTAAAGTMPPGVNASPIVGVGDGSDATPEAAGPPPRPPSTRPPSARPPSDRPPPQEPIAAAPEPVAPRRPAPLPNAQTLVGYLGPEVQGKEPSLRARSDAPPRPRSDPPARPRSDPPARPRSDPPARPRSDPPAQPRSDPPVRPRSDPPEPQRANADAPDGVIALRDVPSGWSPDPSIVAPDSVDELRAIREQLYRFAVRGCFVVGVTGTPDAVEGKSRIAARLASVLAEPGRARVLLMEADFDRPSVHRLMRIEMPLASGFSEQVRRRMKGAKPAPWAIVRCSASLQVLAEGRVRAPGLLSSVQLMDGISELRRYYDVIILDGPTAGSVDGRVLDEISDGLVVVGANEAAMPEIRRQASLWFSKKGWMATLAASVDREKD